MAAVTFAMLVASALLPPLLASPAGRIALRSGNARAISWAFAGSALVPWLLLSLTLLVVAVGENRWGWDPKLPIPYLAGLPSALVAAVLAYLGADHRTG